jgi:predicted transcriptional regulator
MHALVLIRKVSDGNRSRFEIVAEILRRLREPTGKTNLMSHCNMNFTQSGQYLNYMKSNGLIQTDALAGKITYQRTEVGREFLELYNKMVLLLDPNISAPSLI